MAEIPNHGVKRRRPRYRYDDVTWYMEALVDRPEILTAIGGIPDELKIKDCISFRGNSSIKVPKQLPEGPTEYYKALRLVINKILSENDDGQASEKVSCSSKLHPIMYTDKLRSLRYLLDDINKVLMEEEEEEQPHNMNNIDQQLNVAANLVDHPNLGIKQAATVERGVKRRCCTSLLSVETPHGINHILKCDGGDDDPYQSIQCIKGVLFNQLGIVAAIGGIPDELKTKDGVSFWVPHPTLKVPKDLPQDPTEYYKAFSGAIAKSYLENDFPNKVNLAYHKAMRDSSSSSSSSTNGKQEPDNVIDQLALVEVISKQLEEEPKSVIDQQLPRSMLEVNIAADYVDLNQRMKQAARKEIDESVERNYTYCSTGSGSGSFQFLRRDCGDFFEIVYLKAILVNEPGFVSAIGGIPEELKIKDCISFSFPFPSVKVPKNLPTDPTLRDKAMAMVFKNAVDKFGTKKLLSQAYRKALGTSSTSISEQSEKGKEKTHNIDQGPSSVVEVNLAWPIKKFPCNK